MTSLVSGNVSAPNQQPVNTQSTFANAGNAIGQQQGTYDALGASVLPQAGQTTQNLVNNPFAPQAIQGAQTAAGMGTAGATTNFNTGMSLVPYAQQILNTGMDPQNALYAQQLQQTRDQSNVNNAQAGVAETPYGAGVTNQAVTNFNIDWLNNELSRQTQAAGAAGSLDTQASGLYTPAGSQMVQSATIPYATYSDIGTGQDQALSQLLGIGGAGENLSNMNITDLISLLSSGNQANQVANQTYANQLTGAQNTFNNAGTLASAGAGIGGDLAAFL
jgi:hypothetical protein